MGCQNVRPCLLQIVHVLLLQGAQCGVFDFHRRYHLSPRGAGPDQAKKDQTKNEPTKYA